MNGIRKLWPWVGLLAGVLNAHAEGPSIEHAPSQSWKPRTTAVYDTGPACQSQVVRDGYSSIQVNVDAKGCNIVGDAANESSIAIDPLDSRKIVIGWRQFDDVASDFRQAGYAYSHDGGHTWVFPGSLTPGLFGTDPVLASSASSEFLYLSANDQELRLFTSGDAGLTWSKQVIEYFFIDKPWMTADTGIGIGAGNVYIWGADRLWRSGDNSSFEKLFPGDLSPYVAMTVDLDGVLFLADPTSRVQKSGDVQDLSQEPTFFVLSSALPGFGSGDWKPPNPGGLSGQPWIGTDHSNGATRGNVYYLASVNLGVEDDGDVRFARSTNGGETWAPSVRVNDDQPGNGAYHWFGMMSVAPNGRIDAVWNDTRNGGGEPNLCELFYSYSTDAGDTWSPNVPVSAMFDSWVGWPYGQHKIGDYYTMVSDNLGVNVAYAATFNGEQDIYFLRIGPWDCNGNEVDDAADIASATSKDCNGNDVPDECEYRVDIDGDGLTTMGDYTLLAATLSGPSAPLLDKEWAGGGPPIAGALGSGCGELFDANHDGHIDLADYAYLQRVFVAP